MTNELKNEIMGLEAAKAEMEKRAASLDIDEEDDIVVPPYLIYEQATWNFPRAYTYLKLKENYEDLKKNCCLVGDNREGLFAFYEESLSAIENGAENYDEIAHNCAIYFNAAYRNDRYFHKYL
jgi:hypothetical protein